MKTLLTILLAVFLVGGVAYAEHYLDDPEVPEVAEEEKGPEPFLCPVSKISDNGKCMECHQMILENGKPTFGLKEIPLERSFSEKPYGFHIVYSGGKLAGAYLMSDIRPTALDEIKRYMFEHPEIEKLIMEIHSPGGSVMDAWRMVGIIEEMRSRGIEIETRCYGLAASAGGIILIAGDIGSRYVNAHAEIMVHKLWQFRMFSIEDPDSSEDKTEMLKHFQKNINDFFESRTKLTHDVLNDKTFHKMWWMTGTEAVEKYGLADHVIGGYDL